MSGVKKVSIKTPMGFSSVTKEFRAAVALHPTKLDTKIKCFVSIQTYLFLIREKLSYVQLCFSPSEQEEKRLPISGLKEVIMYIFHESLCIPWKFSANTYICLSIFHQMPELSVPIHMTKPERFLLIKEEIFSGNQKDW